MTRDGLLPVSVLRVPRHVADVTQSHLKEAGSYGAEGMVLWAGARHGEVFDVEEALIPEQTAFRSDEGVCVAVDADELFRINVHLHEQGRVLAAQVHSHPGDAYHSETDDAYPIVTTVGGYSLVVPDFGRGPFDISKCAVYRLLPGRGWVGLGADLVTELIEVQA
ncbi:MAG: hypothetical protein V3T86_11615 [Planctomycetota bacterium]